MSKAGAYYIVECDWKVHPLNMKMKLKDWRAPLIYQELWGLSGERRTEVIKDFDTIETLVLQLAIWTKMPVEIIREVLPVVLNSGLASYKNGNLYIYGSREKHVSKGFKMWGETCDKKEVESQEIGDLNVRNTSPISKKKVTYSQEKDELILENTSPKTEKNTTKMSDGLTERNVTKRNVTKQNRTEHSVLGFPSPKGSLECQEFRDAFSNSSFSVSGKNTPMTYDEISLLVNEISDTYENANQGLAKSERLLILKHIFGEVEGQKASEILATPKERLIRALLYTIKASKKNPISFLLTYATNYPIPNGSENEINAIMKQMLYGVKKEVK